MVGTWAGIEPWRGGGGIVDDDGSHYRGVRCVARSDQVQHAAGGGRQSDFV